MFSLVRNFLRLIAALFGFVVLVILIVVSLFEMDFTVETSGLIQPENLTLVRANKSGIVREILVEEGQQVEEGQLLIRLDDSEEKTRLNQLEKDLDIARISLQRELKGLRALETNLKNDYEIAMANLTLARADHERVVALDRLCLSAYRDLMNLPANPGRVPYEVKMREANVEVAMANVRTARVNLSQVEAKKAETEALKKKMERIEEEVRFTEESLAETEIHAPCEGKVLTPELEQLRGRNVSKGEAVLAIGGLGSWIVKAALGEKDVFKIREGQLAKVSLEAHSEHETFEARVERVSLSPIGGEANPSYLTVIGLEDPKEKEANPLRHGLRAKVRIVIDRGRIVSLLLKKLKRTKGLVEGTNIHL